MNEIDSPQIPSKYHHVISLLPEWKDSTIVIIFLQKGTYDVEYFQDLSWGHFNFSSIYKSKRSMARVATFCLMRQFNYTNTTYTANDPKLSFIAVRDVPDQDIGIQ